MIKIYQDSETKGAISNWTGQIWTYLYKMKIGDLVIFPQKDTRKIAIGKITSNYIFNKKQKPYSHIRKVEWLKTEISRTSFDQDLLHSFGAFMTFCEISRNDAKKRINDFLNKKKPITSSNIINESIDKIAKLILAKFKGKRMEYLIENILKAKGYFTYKSPAGPDGGVDILASRGDFGFDNPKICVQVKSGASIGIDILQRLSGTMGDVNAEYGLLASWEGFRKSISKEEEKKKFFNIRLWDQDKIVDEFLKNYDKLDEEIKSEIPLKQI